MSKFFNTSRTSQSADLGGKVVVFPPKEWTEVPDAVGTSSSLQSLLDQRVLVLAKTASPVVAAKASKPKQAPAPAKAPAKAAPPKAVVKAEGDVKVASDSLKSKTETK